MIDATFGGSMERQKTRSALFKFFYIEQFINPVAVTLTMKQRVDGRKLDEIAASENLRHFANRLNSQLLRSAAKRHGRRLQMLAVLESSADGRLHYHMLIDRPEHCDFGTFETVIRDQWSRTTFGYGQVDVQNHVNEGWIVYMLKARQKASLGHSIDWANCHLSRDRTASSGKRLPA